MRYRPSPLGDRWKREKNTPHAAGGGGGGLEQNRTKVSPKKVPVVRYDTQFLAKYQRTRDKHPWTTLVLRHQPHLPISAHHDVLIETFSFNVQPEEAQVRASPSHPP